MEKRLPTFSPLPLLSENDSAPCMGISVMKTHGIEACSIVQRVEAGLRKLIHSLLTSEGSKNRITGPLRILPYEK